MDNSTFYAAAATVIPLLLIAIMATRSLRPGELQRQPTSTVLVFGLPVIGEVAAFAFLFFAPVPTAAVAILAVVTWAGVLSQLAFAAWWLAELLRREPPSTVTSVGSAVDSPPTARTAPDGPWGSPAAADITPDTPTDKTAEAGDASGREAARIPGPSAR